MDKTYKENGAPLPTTKRRVDREGADFYPTPAWATYALLGHEAFEGDIWEPACGDGAISDVLQMSGYRVFSSDLFDRGYGKPNTDFLASDQRAENIITNPPYHSAEAFFHKAWEHTDRKIAFLLRLAFLEGVHRAKRIYAVHPPARVWVFSERITMYTKAPGQVRDKKGSGTTAYAWFVWDKSYSGSTELKHLTPGYKARYKHFDKI